MTLNLIDILFFDDVQLVITLTKNSRGTRCSVLKRSKNMKVTIMNLDLIKIVSDADHVGVQGDEQQCNSVEQGFGFEG